jgi:hypothetical protein
MPALSGVGLCVSPVLVEDGLPKRPGVVETVT